MHADYGGVVPELASRDHVRKTVPLIQAALKEPGLTAKILMPWPIPRAGLVGALLVGATVGRSLVCLGRAGHSGTIWKGTFWRRCWKIIRLNSRLWRCWFPAAIPSLISVTGIGRYAAGRVD
jgi:hypothetical protein